MILVPEDSGRLREHGLRVLFKRQLQRPNELRQDSVSIGNESEGTVFETSVLPTTQLRLSVVSIM